MPIEHFGLGVPDVAAAKAHYDEFMPLVGYMPYFETGYVPTDWQGARWAGESSPRAGIYQFHLI